MLCPKTKLLKCVFIRLVVYLNAVLELRDSNKITLGLVSTSGYWATPLTLLFTTIGITVNELIEDYAIECAGQMVWDFPKDPEEFTFTRDELAKFAQLIVQECIDKIEDVPNAYADYRDQIENAMREYCIYSIKQHFGVE